jgi:hypothetical protein
MELLHEKIKHPDRPKSASQQRARPEVNGQNGSQVNSHHHRSHSRNSNKNNTSNAKSRSKSRENIRPGASFPTLPPPPKENSNYFNSFANFDAIAFDNGFERVPAKSQYKYDFQNPETLPGFKSAPAGIASIGMEQDGHINIKLPLAYTYNYEGPLEEHFRNKVASKKVIFCKSKYFIVTKLYFIFYFF